MNEQDIQHHGLDSPFFLFALNNHFRGSYMVPGLESLGSGSGLCEIYCVCLELYGVGMGNPAKGKDIMGR